MAIVTSILITLSTILLMEAITWVTHKYVMHGFCWFLHEDHHVLTGKPYQKNDSFALVFAIPSITCFFVGSFYEPTWLIFIGLGILLYGIAYMLVHDIFIHRRFKLFRNANNWYAKGIRRAHKMHHKNIHKTGGECFGMLIVPFKYFK